MNRREFDNSIAQIPVDQFLNEFAPSKLNPEDEKIEIENIRRITTVDGRLSVPKGKESERYLPLIKLIEPAWRGTGLVARDVSRWSQDSKTQVTPDIVAYNSDHNGKTPYDRNIPQQPIPVAPPNAHSTDVADASGTSVSMTANTSASLPATTVDSTPQNTSTSSPPATADASTLSSDAAAAPAAPDNTSTPLPSTNSPPGPATMPPKELGDYKANMNYHNVELFLEDKTDNEYAALQKNPQGKFLLGSPDNLRARGQISEYAAEISRCQDRCHLFSILTVHNTVRFLRWDRSGAIASMPVVFDKESGLRTFITFLYRFARMTPRERGHDTTVLEPTAADLQRLEEFKTDKLESLVATHEEFFKEAFDDKVGEAQWPMRVIEVEPFAPKSKDTPTQPIGKKIRLLIRAPRVSSRSPFGRATKGFVALDLDELRLKFLKDSWRYVGGNYNPELEVYEKLYKAGVKNIATVEGGGDVMDPPPDAPDASSGHSEPQTQTTSSHAYLGDDKLARLPQSHYRILIRQLGTPLERYHSSHNLCYYLMLILQGHQSAWLAGILHRDVSPGNILIDEDPEAGSSDAFLLDWDLCRYKHQLNTGPSQKTRSGTWAFISALLLLYPTKQHELADDLESFVHVLHWFCLRFHTHNKSGHPPFIAEALSNVYFKATQVQGYDQGSRQKLDHLQEGTRCFNLVKEEVAPGLEQIIAQLSRLFQDHYATVDIRALEQAREELLNPKGTLPTLQRPDPRPSTGKTKKQRRGRLNMTPPIMSRPPAHASPAVTPKELTPNALVTHVPMINIFQLALSDESKWIMPTPSRLPQPEVEPDDDSDDDSVIILPTDKIPDQFVPDVYRAINMEGPKSKSKSQSQSSVAGGKRSASVANPDSSDLPESKRSRTSMEGFQPTGRKSQSSTTYASTSRLPETVPEEDDVPM